MLRGQTALRAPRPRPPAGGGPPPPPPPANLALNKPASASSTNQGYVPSNAVDGNTGTYWESASNAFPQWLQVDLGSGLGIGSMTLNLPPASGCRARTMLVPGSSGREAL